VNQRRIPLSRTHVCTRYWYWSRYRNVMKKMHARNLPCCQRRCSRPCARPYLPSLAAPHRMILLDTRRSATCPLPASRTSNSLPSVSRSVPALSALYQHNANIYTPYLNTRYCLKNTSAKTNVFKARVHVMFVWDNFKELKFVFSFWTNYEMFPFACFFLDFDLLCILCLRC